MCHFKIFKGFLLQILEYLFWSKPLKANADIVGTKGAVNGNVIMN